MSSAKTLSKADSLASISAAQNYRTPRPKQSSIEGESAREDRTRPKTSSLDINSVSTMNINSLIASVGTPKFQPASGRDNN